MGSDVWLVYEGSAKGKSIRPCKEAIDNFFNEIDDFEYVLLDRTSRPIYRATFETPYETDKGNFFTMQDYVWPSYNNWNPDVDSGLYGKYLTDLIKLAQWHDEYDSNNMWRMETHEAIKNLDWTFFRENGDTISDMSTIDTSKIEPIIQIYGRCFDGIKRYIDNIKCVNNVTYNEKNNLPDYHLSDVAELSGWEVYSINPTAQTETYCDNYYSGRTKGWNATEANIAFMRNLKINSQYIMSLKGTRDGLVTMLGLLGVKEGEYELTEHVAIASSTDSYCDFVKLTQYLDQDEMENPNEYTNMPLFKNVAGINIYRGAEMYDNQPLQDYLSGLALRVNVYHVDENNMFRYCTPWFDNKVKHEGNWYFQCKGGWGEHKNPKDIYAPQLTSATTIEENGIKIYDESEGYLKFASTIEEMLDFPSGKIKNIKRKLLIKYPTFGSVIANLEFQASKDIATAGTDGKVLLYNPKFLGGLSEKQQIFIFAHEVCHVAFEHIFRSEGKDKRLWNIATDSVINALLKQDGLPMVEGGVDIPEAINYDAEEMYNKLLEEKKKQEQQNQQGNQGKQKGQDNQEQQNSQGSQSQQNSQDNQEQQNRQNNQEQQNLIIFFSILSRSFD